MQFAYKITLVIVRYFQFVHESSYKIKFQVCQVKPYKPNKDFFMEKCCEGWTVLHGVCWARGASVAIITDGENTFVRSRIWNLCEHSGNKRLYTFLIRILDYVKCKCMFSIV